MKTESRKSSFAPPRAAGTVESKVESGCAKTMRDEQGRLVRLTPAMGRMLERLYRASFASDPKDRCVHERNLNERKTFNGLRNRHLVGRALKFDDGYDSRVVGVWFINDAGIDVARTRMGGSVL